MKKQPTFSAGLSIDLNTGKINTHADISSSKLDQNTGKIINSSLRINHTQGQFDLEASRQKINTLNNSAKITQIKLDHTGPSLTFSQIKPNYNLELNFNAKPKPVINFKFN